MLVFHDLSEIASRTGSTSVAIGNFDGVHLGHRALIASMLEKAKEEKLTATVLTFFPHPVEVLKPHKHPERLTTASEKLALLESLGVEQVLVARFDERLSQLSPERFFQDYLVSGLRAQSIHVGFNFCFGKNRSGDIQTLKKLTQEKIISLTVESQITANGEKVSSSIIRKLLLEGDVAHAKTLLGRAYSVTGQVIRGDGRGSKIGIPTANLRCPLEKLIPKNGVYAAKVQWQKDTLPAVVNVGVRPTFTDEPSDPVIEVHLLEFESKIYDEFLTVEFVGHLREEKKFSGAEALKAQIQADIELAKQFF